MNVLRLEFIRANGRAWEVLLRIVIAIAGLLIVACAAAMLMPTLSGRGIATSLAYQRTDMAAAILALSWLCIALAAAGVSRIAIGVGAAALLVGFLGTELIGGNPLLGGMAAVLALAPGVVALAAALARRFYAVAPPRPAEKPAEPAAPAVAEAAEEEAERIAADETPAPEPAEKPSEPEPAPAEAAAASAAEPEEAPREEPGKVEVLPPTPQAERDAKERLQFLRMRAMEAGQAPEAVDLWRQISDEYPTYYPALNAEARVLFRLGRTEEARQRLKRSLEVAPDDFATLQLSARLAVNAEDWNEAADYWGEAASIDDLTSDMAAAYVTALTRAERAEEARARYHEFADLWPDEWRLTAVGANAAEAAGEDAEAFELWKSVAEAEPGAFAHRRRAIRSLLRQERFVEAAEMAQAYKLDSGGEPQAVALAERVVNAMSRNAEKASEQGVEVLETLAPEDPAAWRSLIERRLSAGDVEGAEEAFQKAVGHDLAVAEILRAGAQVAARAGRRDLEGERWSALAEIAPDDVNANRRAAIALAGEGDSAAALAFADRALKETPDDEALIRVKGNAAIRVGDWQAALDAWKSHTSQVGPSALATLKCAQALRGLERYDDAEALLSAAIGQFDDEPDLWEEYARIAQRRGGMQEASIRWRRAAELRPTGHVAWNGLIAALRKLGETERAEDALAEAATKVRDISKLVGAGGADETADVV